MEIFFIGLPIYKDIRLFHTTDPSQRLHTAASDLCQHYHLKNQFRSENCHFTVIEKKKKKCIYIYIL